MSPQRLRPPKKVSMDLAIVSVDERRGFSDTGRLLLPYRFEQFEIRLPEKLRERRVALEVQDRFVVVQWLVALCSADRSRAVLRIRSASPTVTLSVVMVAVGRASFRVVIGRSHERIG